MTIKDLSIEIQNFIDRMTYMDNETGDNYLELQFSTREHGDVYNEEAGGKDVDEAYKIWSELRLRYGTEIFETVDDINTGDEWVYLYVILDEDECEKYIKKKIVADYVGKLN